MHYTSGCAGRGGIAPLCLLFVGACLYTPPRLPASAFGDADLPPVNPCLPLVVKTNGETVPRVGDNVLLAAPISSSAESLTLNVASSNPDCAATWHTIDGAFACDGANSNAPCTLPPNGENLGVWLSPDFGPVRTAAARVMLTETGVTGSTFVDLGLTFLPAPSSRACFATVDGDLAASGQNPALPTTLDHAAQQAAFALDLDASQNAVIYLKSASASGNDYYTNSLDLKMGTILVGGLDAEWRAPTWDCGCSGAVDAHWDASSGASMSPDAAQCLGMHSVILPSAGFNPGVPLVRFNLAPTAEAAPASALIDVVLKTHDTDHPSELLVVDVGSGSGVIPPVFKLLRSELTLWRAPIPAMQVTSAVGKSVQLELDRFSFGMFDGLGLDANEYRFIETRTALAPGSTMQHSCVGVEDVLSSVGVYIAGGGSLEVSDSAFVTTGTNVDTAILLQTAEVPANLKVTTSRLLVSASADARGIYAADGNKLSVDQSELHAKVGSSGDITGIRYGGNDFSVTGSLLCAHGTDISQVWPIYANAYTTDVSRNIIDQVDACGADTVSSLSLYEGIQVDGSVPDSTATVTGNLICGLPNAAMLTGIRVSAVVATMTDNVVNGEPCGRPIPSATTSAVGIELVDTLAGTFIARNWIDPGTIPPDDAFVFALGLSTTKSATDVFASIQSNALIGGGQIFTVDNTKDPVLHVQVDLNTILLTHRALYYFAVFELQSILGYATTISDQTPVTNNLFLFPTAPTTPYPSAPVDWSNAYVMRNTYVVADAEHTGPILSATMFNSDVYVAELSGVMCQAGLSDMDRPRFNPHIRDLSEARPVDNLLRSVFGVASDTLDLDGNSRDPYVVDSGLQYRGAVMSAADPFCDGTAVRRAAPTGVGVPPP